MEDLEREREVKDRLIEHMQKNSIKQVDVCCSENIPPHTPRGKGGIFFEKNDQHFLQNYTPHTPLSSILLTSYTSHIPTHHPSYLNNFLQ